jgi:chemotaxis protein methyltransferase CheR
MTPFEFEYLAALIKKRSGLALTRDKDYLLESRLRPVARKYGQEDLSGLVRWLQAGGGTEPALCEITEAMTTNESMFFRDNKPFTSLRQRVLPAMLPALGGRGLSIWSAACSHGQEPYSLAMLLEEAAALLGSASYKILATDLDTQVLKKAKEGIYTQFEVQRGLPIHMLLKYFTQQEQNAWKINEALQRHITFRSSNLLENFSDLGMFDIIMCRNVLIYFDEETKKQVLARLCERLHPHGILFLGSAETAIGMCENLRPLTGEPGMFVLRDSRFSLSA